MASCDWYRTCSLLNQLMDGLVTWKWYATLVCRTTPIGVLVMNPVMQS
jgi:hypothetical protein